MEKIFKNYEKLFPGAKKMTRKELKEKFGISLFEGEVNTTSSGCYGGGIPKNYQIKGRTDARLIFPGYPADMEICRRSWGDYPNGGTTAYLMDGDNVVAEQTHGAHE